MDNANRPYLISLDWLSLSVEITEFFRVGLNGWGYELRKKNYGSKIWKDIYDVFDQNSDVVATLACHPHDEAMPQARGVLKIENAVLYSEQCIDQIAAVIKCCGLKYRGISRVDIAYDCNEYYNGLRPDNLVKRYIDGEYVKVGQNRYMLVGDGGYYGVTQAGGQSISLWTEKPDFLKTEEEIKAEIKAHAEQTAELIKANIEPQEKKKPRRCARPQFKFGSITWGFRSSQIQVQIYDKSRELKEVTFKKYIWDAWMKAGLDVNRPIFRTEIRIQNQGKHLLNIASNEKMVLQLQDLIMQQQVEQIFHDYAEKYCRFHIFDEQGDAIRHKERLPKLQIFSLNNSSIVRPKRTAFGKDITRSVKIAANQLCREIDAAQRVESPHVGKLRDALDYLDTSYNMRAYLSEKMTKDLIMQGIELGAGKELTPDEYFSKRLQGEPDAQTMEVAKSLKALEDRMSDFAMNYEMQLCEDPIPPTTEAVQEYSMWPIFPTYDTKTFDEIERMINNS